MDIVSFFEQFVLGLYNNIVVYIVRVISSLDSLVDTVGDFLLGFSSGVESLIVFMGNLFESIGVVFSTMGIVPAFLFPTMFLCFLGMVLVRVFG